jgi:hypothetical protein
MSPSGAGGERTTPKLARKSPVDDVKQTLRVPERLETYWSVICITDQYDGKPYDTRVVLGDKFRGESDWFDNALGTASSCPRIRAGLMIGIYRGRNCVVVD